MGGEIISGNKQRDGQGLLITTFHVAQSDKPAAKHEKVEFHDISEKLSELTLSGFYC